MIPARLSLQYEFAPVTWYKNSFQCDVNDVRLFVPA